MPAAPDTFALWLAQAHLAEQRLTPEQRAVLQAAWHFRQTQGHDSYSTRLLTHFLLHAGTGLKVASLARLVGISRQTASHQQGLTSKVAVQQAHHRLDGRPYGKLLPRFAGPIAGFLFAHPKATRADLIDFIDQTFAVRVSRIALYHFLKKFGLDQTPAALPLPAGTATDDTAVSPTVPVPAGGVPALPAGRPLPTPAPPFSPHARSTRAPSSSSHRR
jgi:hypothetical protein